MTIKARLNRHRDTLVVTVSGHVGVDELVASLRHQMDLADLGPIPYRIVDYSEAIFDLRRTQGVLVGRMAKTQLELMHVELSVLISPEASIRQSMRQMLPESVGGSIEHHVVANREQADAIIADHRG